MFATIKSLIPEPRQADQPRHYVGRHRQPETVAARATVPVIPAPAPTPDAETSAAADSAEAPAAAPAAVPDSSAAAHDPGEPAPRGA